MLLYCFAFSFCKHRPNNWLFTFTASVSYSISFSVPEVDKSLRQLGCLILRTPSPNSRWGGGGGTSSEFLRYHQQQNITPPKGRVPAPRGRSSQLLTYHNPNLFPLFSGCRGDISFLQLSLHNLRVPLSFLHPHSCLNKLLIKFSPVKHLARLPDCFSDWILTDTAIKTQRKEYTFPDVDIREGLTKYMYFRWATNDNFDVR